MAQAEGKPDGGALLCKKRNEDEASKPFALPSIGEKATDGGGEEPTDGGGEGHRLGSAPERTEEDLELLQKEPVHSLTPEEVKHRVHNHVSDPLPGTQ